MRDLIEKAQWHKEWRAQLDAFIETHEQRLRVSYGRESFLDKARQIVGRYHDNATTRLRQIKSFRDGWLVELKAMAMVVEMVGMAGTHGEKNARLRGLHQLIENRIRHLRDQSFEIDSTWWKEPDLFRSDYPVREMGIRIRQLQDENEGLKQQRDALFEQARKEQQ